MILLPGKSSHWWEIHFSCRICTWYNPLSSSMHSPIASSYASPELCAPPCTGRKENSRHKSWVSQSEFWGQPPSELPFKVRKVIKRQSCVLHLWKQSLLRWGLLRSLGLKTRSQDQQHVEICENFRLLGHTQDRLKQQLHFNKIPISCTFNRSTSPDPELVSHFGTMT